MKPSRVLRVGGHDADNQILEMTLRGAGLADLKFVMPPEALEIIAENGTDILLLDLVGKSADIFQVLRAAVPAESSARRLPVIVTAPLDAGDRIQACLQRGAEDFLTTPFDSENPLLVTRRIELCLNRRQLSDLNVRVRTAIKDPNATAILDLEADASSRFVPREFLENLQRRSLAEVKLGDHVLRDMTVLFSDIRDFTALSENLTPQQNFGFLNSYLLQVTPVIRAHRGFIDKYIGDGIMALFPVCPADALQAALGIQKALAKYNLGRQAAGYVPIRIGIGMHHGDLILGTIGEEERMQTTVISDVVNVASRIEGLTKTFGASLLVSGTVVDGLAEDHKFKLRRLSAVKAKGKRQSIGIYECFDNDPDALFKHKQNTLEVFSRAMDEFTKGMFLTAGKIFARIAEMERSDTVAAYYRDSCSLTAVHGRGLTPWDGAEVVTVK
ncbi:MAG: adenylate/guanylate cyclase domain-containing protein [Candidatus Baltobacteraceae bacterium]